MKRIVREQSMIYKTVKHLADYFDKKVWISDDRISASLTDQCQGIGQIDFHGIQPVSRNAKLLASREGVLRFCFFFEKPESASTIPMKDIKLFPFGAEIFCRLEDAELRLKIDVNHNTLSASCRVKLINGLKGKVGFQVLWNPGSMTTDVHGERTWKPVVSRSSRLQLHALDKIYLNQWLERSGDYQGDFLIPEGWRRLIFKRRCISGTARKSDLRLPYRGKPLLLYNADTWIILEGENYVISRSDADAVVFTQEAIVNDSWKSDHFMIRFSTRPPECTGVGENKTRSSFSRQTKRYRQLDSRLPRLHCRRWPAVEAFFNLYPLIVESARVQDYGMMRACPGTYYWIWAWDNLVTLQSMMFWGDHLNIRSMIDFMRINRDLDGSIPMRWSRHLEPMDSRGFGAIDFLFAKAVMGLYNETLDKSVLYANYTTMYMTFQNMCELVQDRGFFPSIGMYPDLPEKMGRHESSLVCIDQSAFYSFCRLIAKAADTLGDDLTVERAYNIQSLIEEHFEDYFWDNSKGFLYDSYDPAVRKAVKSYPLFSLLFYESAMGNRLLRGKEKRVAQFVSTQLLTPHGVQLTPDWDIYHNTEPAMSSWYPHWDFPAIKMLSKTGDFDSIHRWLQLVETCFQRLGYCPEFVARGEPLGSVHGAAWNLNCGSGWYNALLRALVGVDFDGNGLTIMPTEYRCELKNLCYRGGRWNIKTEGQGRYISTLLVDNDEIKYLYKIPSSHYSPGDHDICVRYEKNPNPDPVLFETDAKVINAVRREKRIQYQISGTGPAEALFSGKAKRITLDEIPLTKKFLTDSTWMVRLDLTGEHTLYLQE